ncbi:hypothetical protein AC249_AIPGENE4613 [Exaiptasia diaphana]|nr:hypothetical protein AC249_AIPGENE4613 [Exaiptasia diaphana]
MKINKGGISTEGELILCRAGIFEPAATKEEIVVCPKHRDQLGIYWRGQYKQCQVPSTIAAHSKTGTKGDRSLSRELSQAIFRRTKVLLPVGSSICRRCRELYACKEQTGSEMDHVL